MGSRWLRNLVSGLIALALIVVAVLYLRAHPDHLHMLLDLSVESVALVLALSIVGVLARGEVNRVFYNSLGAGLDRGESTALAVLNTLGNQLPMSAGLVAKGTYLVRKHGIKALTFVSATSVLFLFFISVNGATGIVSLLWIHALGGNQPPGYLALGFGLMLAAILLPVLPTGKKKSQRKFLADLGRGWSVMRGNTGLLFRTALLQLVGILLVSGRLLVLFTAMGQQVAFQHCLLFASASILTRLLNFIPGGWGIREAIVAGLASMLGLDFGMSAIIVGVDRLAMIVGTLVLAPPFAGRLSGARRASPGREGDEPGSY
jgi:uncharacterized membrane protein YbhN (UPF0104 family)